MPPRAATLASARVNGDPRLPAALNDPAAFPGAPAEVELRETHISWVVLAGDRVYKVKKPVSFPFLDYGTLDRRRGFCEQELRLNRRFAPELYLDVVALVPRGDHGVAVAAAEDPRAVEYAVLMRRYDEGATLAARLAAGAVPATEVERVGAAVARWHGAAPPAGGPGLAPVAEETFATLAQSGRVAPGRLSALERFVRAGLRGLGPELERRAQSGLVRDGHGDLRAEHVVCGETVTAVDGLEFERDLRVADVAYDLAFLVMDVARRDEALSRALVRGYEGAGGDAGTPALLAFLCAVRALVRAKVDLVRAAQLTGDAAGERGARGEELLALAERFAWRARLPEVTAVAGLAASGKSTVARALAEATGRPVLSSDVVRKAGRGLAPEERAGPDLYAGEVSTVVYAELGRRARTADGGAIVDATFRRPDDVAAFTRHAPAAGWIVCRAPAAVLLERARRRAEDPARVSDAGLDVVAAQLAAGEELPLPAAPRAVLDTTRPDAMQALAEALDARLRGNYGARPDPIPDGGPPARP